MKILIIGVVCFLVFAGASTGAFFVGQTMGYGEGEKTGEMAGLKSGRVEGFNNGKEVGYEEGKLAGIEQGASTTWETALTDNSKKDSYRQTRFKIQPIIKCLLAADALNKRTEFFDKKLDIIRQQRDISPTDFGTIIGLEKGLIEGYLLAYKTIYSYTQIQAYYFDIFTNQNCENLP